MEIKIARDDEDILKCWEVLKVLRPHLIEADFLATIKEMIQQGYQLVFIEEDGKAVAAIGFRYQHFLYNGRHFYIDDLSTLPGYRGKGHGAKLLDFVIEKAKADGLNEVTLDSGYLRLDAHRLYLNNGFILSAHHFSKKI